VAVQVLGAAEALREQVGVPLQPAERPAYQRHVAASRDAVPGSEEFSQAWAIGRTLNLDAVVALTADLNAMSPRSPLQG
jgi:hypothetical protein